MRPHLITNPQFNTEHLQNSSGQPKLIIRRYHCLTALFMMLFGKIISVKSGNRTLYLNRSDYTHALFRKQTGEIGTPKLDWIAIKELQDYFFNTSNKHPTVDEIGRRVHNLREQMWNGDQAPDREKLLIALKNIAPVPPIRQHEKEDLENTLKEGDILVYNAYKNYSGFDRVIRSAQNISRLFMRGANKDTYVATHIAIYLGNRKLAEASDSKKQKCVRIVDLDSFSATLEKGHRERYRVFRATGTNGEAIAKAAADTAKQYADEVTFTKRGESAPDESKKPTKILYTLRKAALCLFKNSNFGTKARERFLKATIMRELGFHTPLSSSGGVRDFFCSYFIGWLYQAGQHREALEDLRNKGMPLLDHSKINYIPHVFQHPARPEGMRDAQYEKLIQQKHNAHRKQVKLKSQQAMKVINKWAKDNAKQYRKEIDQIAYFKRDVKSTSPQRFLVHMLQETDRFKEVCHIIPPEPTAAVIA